MIDLHVHSNCSDGTFAPKELVDYAMEKGLYAFALTDHDTVDGLEEALQYAESLRGASASGVPRPDSHCAEKCDTAVSTVPLVIPGIELSTEYEGCDVHILGLDIDYKDAAFRAYLKEFVDSRILRNQKMCALLREKAGVDISYDKLAEAFPGSVITRAHYAKYLINHGYAKDMKEAFACYVGDHCPCFIPREKVSPAMAVELILNAGGIPVLAHPMLYDMGDDALDILICRLKSAGLIGIEALYGTHTAADEQKLRSLARKHHLLVSGGSDFHGSIKPNLDLGTGYGSLRVPDDVWTTLQKSKHSLFFCDLDGTLLKDDSTVSPAMREALIRMAKAGTRLVISSGRPLPSIQNVIREEGIACPHMLISANNGAIIHDCDSGQNIWECRLSGSDVALIVQKAMEAGIHIQGYTDSEIVCRSATEEVRKYMERNRMTILCADDLAAALPGGSIKMLAIHLTDKSVLERFQAELLSDAALQDRVQAAFSSDQFLEILPIEAGKGTALRFVADYLPVLRTRTYAAGNEQNDVSMLQAAHVGIAVANAVPEAKEAADIITQKSNDEDGLLEIIEGIQAKGCRSQSEDMKNWTSSNPPSVRKNMIAFFPHLGSGGDAGISV